MNKCGNDDDRDSQKKRGAAWMLHYVSTDNRRCGGWSWSALTTQEPGLAKKRPIHLGGIRLPEVEAPIARYTFSGALNDYFGKREAFPAAELKALYPTHARYVEDVSAAATAAHRAGVIPLYRVKEYVKAAQDAAIPA